MERQKQIAVNQQGLSELLSAESWKKFNFSQHTGIAGSQLLKMKPSQKSIS